MAGSNADVRLINTSLAHRGNVPNRNHTTGTSGTGARDEAAPHLLIGTWGAKVSRRVQAGAVLSTLAETLMTSLSLAAKASQTKGTPDSRSKIVALDPAVGV
jgi:hypothetical protein